MCRHNMAHYSAAIDRPGTYYIEYERYTIRPAWAREKLGPYRKMAAIGRPLPLLVVCAAEQGEEQYQAPPEGCPC